MNLLKVLLAFVFFGCCIAVPTPLSWDRFRNKFKEIGDKSANVARNAWGYVNDHVPKFHFHRHDHAPNEFPKSPEMFLYDTPAPELPPSQFNPNLGLVTPENPPADTFYNSPAFNFDLNRPNFIPESPVPTGENNLPPYFMPTLNPPNVIPESPIPEVTNLPHYFKPEFNFPNVAPEVSAAATTALYNLPVFDPNLNAPNVIPESPTGGNNVPPILDSDLHPSTVIPESPVPAGHNNLPPPSMPEFSPPNFAPEDSVNPPATTFEDTVESETTNQQKKQNVDRKFIPPFIPPTNENGNYDEGYDDVNINNNDRNTDQSYYDNYDEDE